MEKRKTVCDQIIDLDCSLDDILEEEIKLIFCDICRFQNEIECENNILKSENNILLNDICRYKSLYDAILIGTIVLNNHLFVTDSNKFANDLFVNDSNSILSTSFLKYIYIGDQMKARKHFEDILHYIEHRCCALRFVRVNGDLFWAQLGTRVRNAGDSYEYHLTITEIDAIKQVGEQAQEKRNNNLDMSRRILDSLPLRLFWKDSNLRFLGCNVSFAQDAGFASPEELIGLDDFSMGWKERAEQYRQDDYEVMITGCGKIHHEKVRSSTSGEQAWLSVSKMPLRGDQGEMIGVLGWYEDITQQKVREDAVLRAQKFDSLGELATGMAHHFNDILMAIIGDVASAKAMLSPADVAFERLSRVELSALRAEAATRQFLAFSKESFSARFFRKGN